MKLDAEIFWGCVAPDWTKTSTSVTPKRGLPSASAVQAVSAIYPRKTKRAFLSLFFST